MGIFDYFKSKSAPTSASVAKDRLQIIVAHERTKRCQPDYLPKMQQEIIDVIRKYVDVGSEDVQIQLENTDDCSVLELNVTLPEHN
ncbi:cell division topological specificity factor MinE [Marinomonas algarum]|uniref:Cell division topological specificity factor n=1 Tax=Marinomonas algarum TaxID=2883105 RepID=A0A9X1IKM4_9GAMM|nr:cell division topological specificity factor MinE [Marinomonas algarum]